jgi:hypothetical protein
MENMIKCNVNPLRKLNTSLYEYDCIINDMDAHAQQYTWEQYAHSLSALLQVVCRALQKSMCSADEESLAVLHIRLLSELQRIHHEWCTGNLIVSSQQQTETESMNSADSEMDMDVDDTGADCPPPPAPWDRQGRLLYAQISEEDWKAAEKRAREIERRPETWVSPGPCTALERCYFNIWSSTQDLAGIVGVPIGVVDNEELRHRKTIPLSELTQDDKRRIKFHRERIDEFKLKITSKEYLTDWDL